VLVIQNRDVGSIWVKLSSLDLNFRSTLIHNTVQGHLQGNSQQALMRKSVHESFNLGFHIVVIQTKSFNLLTLQTPLDVIHEHVVIAVLFLELRKGSFAGILNHMLHLLVVLMGQGKAIRKQKM